MDIPVNVSVLFIGPVGVVFEDSGMAEPISTTYTSTATVNSFGREDSGLYRCIALVNSTADNIISSTGFGTARITTGKPI